MALLTCALVAFAAATSSGAEQPADRVLTGGNIETMNPNQPNVQAVAMKDGKIVFVGSDEDAKEYIGDKTDVIDLNGKYVTPGLIESHNHVIASTWMTTGVDLSSAKSGEDVGRILKEHADKHPDEKVIVGNGWALGNMGNKYFHAKDLDAFDIDRPVIAIGNFCHDAVFNSVGLEAAGINNETAVDTQPGVMYWDRDENGDITGLAIEVQYAQAYVNMGAWQPETMVPESIEYLQGYLATKGVTTALTPGIVSPGVVISADAMKKDMRDIMKILQARVDSGDAQLRLNVLPFFKTPDADPEDIVNFAVEMRDLYNSDMLYTGGIKIHPELAWAVRGATQLVPYLPAKKGDAPTWGFYGVNPEQMFEVVQRANRVGLDIVTHADGARLVKRLTGIYIESLEKNPGARNRLDHITMMDSKTRAKVVEHNIPVNATPMFCNEMDAGAGGELIYRFMERDYVHDAYGQYTELAQLYKNVSLSGDTPGSSIDKAYPAYVMQQAMTLVEPSIEGSKAFPDWRPKMSIDQVLNAYTVAPAWQMRMEDKIGSIEVGKYADLAIFEKSLREIAPENMIAESKVFGTILNGKFTYDSRQEGAGLDADELETMKESLRTGGTFHCGNCKRVFKELEMLEQRFKKLEQEKE